MLEFLDTWLFHWSPEKAIWLAGHTLSWDARCAGIYVGCGIALLYHLVQGRRAKHLPPRPVLIAAALLFVPLFADVAAIATGVRAPSNDWRFATGIAFGAGLIVFLYPAVMALVLRRGAERAAIGGGGGFCAFLGAGAMAWCVKALEGAASYFILEALGILGMAGLFIMIALGASGAARLFNRKTGEKWDQAPYSAAEGQRR